MIKLIAGPANTNWEPGPADTNWGSGFVNANWGPGMVNTNWGSGPANSNSGAGADVEAGDQTKQRAGGWEIQIPLRHKFLRSQSIEDRKAYNKQRNYGISLIRKIKNDYYN